MNLSTSRSLTDAAAPFWAPRDGPLPLRHRLSMASRRRRRLERAAAQRSVILERTQGSRLAE